MAIDQVIPYPEAHDLAQTQKGFYSCAINVSHWQLRHYISTPEVDHLYYASGTDVFCLNTATKKRKHVASLPFEARCTASGYGWVCVGGEHEGHFAAIKLDGSGPRTLDVDAALPIEGWRPSNLGRRAPTVKVERIGEEIVNSISIHRIQDEEAHLDDIVAVLTNNDKTVRIYSLPSGQETRVKDLPFAINHATISPDGQMMVAVGDYNQAYFFTREIVDTPPQIPKPHNRLTSASVEWKLSNVVTLHVTNSEGPVGYFTTAWSPSGLLVAVGSEGGYITVIDTEMLANADYEDDEAVVAIVPGSRPDIPSPHPGAIRSMVFSPEPWDLLIWAEDQGRVCIGDLRTGLKSKQVINLEPNNEGAWESLPFEDMPSEEPSLPHLDDLEADILRRYRNAPPDNASAVNFATEYIEAQQLQRRRRQQMADMRALAGASGSPRHTPDPGEQPGLTQQEQQVLDALRTSRQREESRANGQTPRSVNYTSADMFTGTAARSSTSTSNTADSARPSSDDVSSVLDSFPELSRTRAATDQRPSSSQAPDASNDLPPLHVLAQGIWGSSSRTSQAPRRPLVAPPHTYGGLLDNHGRLPRRRQSVALNLLASENPAPGSAANNTNSARASSDEADDDNPWRTIEEHMMAEYRGPLFEGAARAAQGGTPPPGGAARAALTERETRIEQALARSRERSWRATRSTNVLGAAESALIARSEARMNSIEGYEALLRRAQRYGIGARPSAERLAERTAGLAISPDGRTLWAACEKGIFEIQIRVKDRMFLPAIDPR